MIDNNATRYEEATVYIDELPENVDLDSIIRMGLRQYGLDEWAGSVEVEWHDWHEK